MKEPKKKQEVLNEFKKALKKWLTDHNNVQSINKSMWEQNVNDFVKECATDLQQEMKPCDIAEKIVKKIQDQKYIYITSRISGVTAESLKKELEPILNDWYLTEEELEWLKANNQLNNSDYI